MARKRWNPCKLNKNKAAEIAQSRGIDPILALLLLNRGVNSPAQLDQFFSESEPLLDPMLLPDMGKAVEQINRAVFDGERICVYGDYDCDGVTATALLYSYLESQGADVTYLLPDRQKDGYGLSRGVVERIHKTGTHLIVTVDNGIAAVEEADYIYQLGMELVVTDHHLPGEHLPRAEAVVDPHRSDIEQPPYTEYCGAGLALLLCCAIEGNTDRVMEEFSDYAAIGTVADMVPLTGENRKIVLYGLHLMNETPRPGISAILDKAGVHAGTVDSTNISFGIAPRINAAGRMENAEHALDLLLAEDPEEARNLAEEVNQLNENRHEEENRIYQDALKYLDAHPAQTHAPVLVVAGEGWHEGVLGIVASKLLEKYLRPVIVLSIRKDGSSKGSARSIPGFSIYDALCACAEDLTMFGGHTLAAGLSLPAEKIDSFRKDINRYAAKTERPYPTTQIDIRLNPAGISLDLLDSLETLEPFGMSNQAPVFGLYHMVIDSVSAIGEDGSHRRIQMHREGKPGRCTAVYFRVPDFPYLPGDQIDTVVTLHRNFYNGVESVSIFIEDIRPAGTDDESMVLSETLFDRLMSGQTLTPKEAAFAFPDRRVFAKVYSFLRKNPCSIRNYEYIDAKSGGGPGPNGPRRPLIQTRIALEAMRELGLLEINQEGWILLPHVQEKVDLTTAPILQKLHISREKRG